MADETKQFFLPGDLVTIRQEIPNKPIMLVVKKISKTVITRDHAMNEYFQGILCRWFTVSGELQEAIFNTKDLIKL